MTCFKLNVVIMSSASELPAIKLKLKSPIIQTGCLEDCKYSTLSWNIIIQSALQEGGLSTHVNIMVFRRDVTLIAAHSSIEHGVNSRGQVVQHQYCLGNKWLHFHHDGFYHF